MRIGIYSGTFDPVHNGHLAFAHEAVQQCGLDKVFFLVEPRPLRKQGIKAFEHRVAMVKLAIKDTPAFGTIVLEQQRFTTSNTLPILQARFKGAELYMLMGDDTLGHFANADWPNVEKLIQSIRFIIGIRHMNLAEVKDRIKTVEKTRGFGVRYKVFRASQPEISSSQAREVFRKGKAPTGIPQTVVDYIVANGLYASSDTSSTKS